MDDLTSFIMRELERRTTNAKTDSETATARLSLLRLRRKTIEVLNAAGVSTIQEVARLAPRELATLPGVHLSMVAEIGEALTLLRSRRSSRTGTQSKTKRESAAVVRPRKARSRAVTAQDTVAMVTMPPLVVLSGLATHWSRLLAVVLSLAYEENAKVNWQRLQEFATGAGICVQRLPQSLAELRTVGFGFSVMSATYLWPVTCGTTRVEQGDLPGKLTDKDLLRRLCLSARVLQHSEVERPEIPKINQPENRGRLDSVSDPLAPFDLNQLERTETRLFAFVLALADSARARVNFVRLREFAAGAYLRMPTLQEVSNEARTLGFLVDTTDPERLRLMSNHNPLDQRVNLPGKLSDAEFLMPILKRCGVIVQG